MSDTAPNNHGRLVVLASANAGKAREFAQLLSPLGITLKMQSEFRIDSPEETGQSFLENALQKARYVSARTKLPALADDSGLCVDFLQGAPGILSARFSGTHGDDAANNEKLLDLLYGVPAKERTAHYVCSLALVRSAEDAVPLTVTEIWQGRIGTEMRGHNGFGYDPLFVVEGRGLTAAELPPQLKNLLSHRGKALRRLLALLKGREALF
ncbi:MAG: RdgB/HAM1 family non-canonical purine NTP pyrophosphatase [Succinivibrio sp.]|nr:RdgB/HAM1 family non-canonical purine NTP pyrophosphatase [Succinivibrio sp.]